MGYSLGRHNSIYATVKHYEYTLSKRVYTNPIFRWCTRTCRGVYWFQLSWCKQSQQVLTYTSITRHQFLHLNSFLNLIPLPGSCFMFKPDMKGVCFDISPPSAYIHHQHRITFTLPVNHPPMKHLLPRQFDLHLGGRIFWSEHHLRSN